MKNYLYKVILKGWETSIWGFNEKEATILAQAEAIENARDYTLISIERIY